MDIEIIGTITNILPKVTGTSQKGDWSKQEYVINVEGENEQYPRSICFQIFGEEKINTAALRLNERVRVHLDIDCHEYNETFYNQISCWRVDRNNEQQANQGLFSSQAPQQFSPQANNQRTPQRGNAQQQTEGSPNDLPF